MVYNSGFCSFMKLFKLKMHCLFFLPFKYPIMFLQSDCIFFALSMLGTLLYNLTISCPFTNLGLFILLRLIFVWAHEFARVKLFMQSSVWYSPEVMKSLFTVSSFAIFFTLMTGQIIQIIPPWGFFLFNCKVYRKK